MAWVEWVSNTAIVKLTNHDAMSDLLCHRSVLLLVATMEGLAWDALRAGTRAWVSVFLCNIALFLHLLVRGNVL